MNRFARRSLVAASFLALAALLAGCSPAPIPTGIDDPNEARNREVHAFNKQVDRNLVRPVSQAYGTVVPGPVRRGFSNFSANADMPRMVVNNVLQGRAEDAIHNTFRFLVNTTFGIGGLLDPATDMGLAERETDFGETLHVWGMAEGPYREVPVFGPSTRRDSLGSIVDLVLNPLSYELPDDERLALTGLGVASELDERYRFTSTYDSILYESADSYAQARLAYLQNRRFELGGSVADVSGDPLSDPYYDPYEDPDVR